MPKRSSEQPLPEPTADALRTARLAAELTQAQAAELVHLSSQTRWAEYENGTRNIDLARWELFLIKTKQRKPN
ncbi:MAG: helix-turn-helix transcriptional regulator [Betaproteobacteria bacterium]|nr:helix-turn-helix transcriptional regulator [Betaproteobacteria bacterium]